MTLKEPGMLAVGARVQYLHTLVLVETLCRFYRLSDEVRNTNPENLTSIILVLG